MGDERKRLWTGLLVEPQREVDRALRLLTEHRDVWGVAVKERRSNNTDDIRADVVISCKRCRASTLRGICSGSAGAIMEVTPQDENSKRASWHSLKSGTGYKILKDASPTLPKKATRTEKRAATNEVSTRPRAKKPALAVADIEKRISLLHRKPLAVISLTHGKQIIGVTAVERTTNLAEATAALQLAQDRGAWRMVVSLTSSEHWLARAMGSGMASFAGLRWWSRGKSVVALVFIGLLSCSPKIEPINLEDLEGIKDTLSTKMTDHYEKVTHFAVELTETEFADLHQKVFEKGVADLAEAKCPVKKFD